MDTYTTSGGGTFTTKEYPCGTDYSIREISPSEGYLLDETVYPVGAEPGNFTLGTQQRPHDRNRGCGARLHCHYQATPTSPPFQSRTLLLLRRSPPLRKKLPSLKNSRLKAQRKLPPPAHLKMAYTYIY